jgi:hypothetical protein
MLKRIITCFSRLLITLLLSTVLLGAVPLFAFGETGAGQAPGSGSAARLAKLLDCEPPATLISEQGSKVEYQFNDLVDCDHVEMVWYFPFGFFRTFEDNLKNNVKFYDKHTGEPVALPNIVTVPITVDNYYMEVTDWWFKRITAHAPLGLTLKSARLQPSTTYVIEIGPDFEFNNGLKLGSAYIFEFTTKGIDPDGTITAVPSHEQIPEQGIPDKTTDLRDISGHWAEAGINRLVAAGVMSGYPDHTFKPDDTITRAEFCTVLVKALRLTGGSEAAFVDLGEHWAKDYIAAAAANGIVHGTEGNKFAPDLPVTREQMALMICLAKKLAAFSGWQEYSDADQISYWARDAVKTVSAEKLMSGYPDNSFKPQNFAGRAEAAAVIVKLMQEQKK